jgi:tRNA wybutosine-synthesizing protein 4
MSEILYMLLIRTTWIGSSSIMTTYHSTDLQTHIPFQVQNPSCPIMLHNHSSEVIDNETTILVVGGGGNCFSFGTAFNNYGVRIDLQQFR